MTHHTPHATRHTPHATCAKVSIIDTWLVCTRVGMMLHSDKYLHSRHATAHNTHTHRLK
jgi:hypothetical protein